MRKHGFKRENYDFLDIDMLYPDDDALTKYFSELQPHVVGLSAVVSTSYSQVKRISRIVRSILPETWIVLGGNLAASSEPVLFNTDVDVTIVGDGEIAWVQFLEYVIENGRRRDYDALRSIDGICFLDEEEKLHFKRFGKQIAATEMPLPDYELLESGLKDRPELIHNYFRDARASGWFDLDDRAQDPSRRPNIAGLFASKGCVARCTFCQRSTKGYRVQPYEHLDAHLSYIKTKYNVGFIQILDENFGSNRAHSYEIAQILHKHNLLWMATGVRCKSTTPEDLAFYRDHGCSALKYGVESGSQLILDLMEKVFSLDDVVSAVRNCISLGIYSPLAVMVGMPGETEETARDTGKLIGSVAAEVGVHPEHMGYEIFYALPLPGTPLYEYGEVVGVIDKKPKGAGEYLERVTNAGTYKRYYVNLNGAPDSEVLFWEYAVRLEASRVFRMKRREVEITNPAMAEMITLAREKELSNNTRWSLKYTALDFTKISYFIDSFVIGSKLIDSLPRVIVYPIIKWLLNVEFRLQNLSTRNRNNNLFVYRKKVARLSTEDLALNERSAKARSLRGIIARIKTPNIKRVNRAERYQPLTARELLTKGM